jgi:hypothetical protein
LPELPGVREGALDLDEDDSLRRLSIEGALLLLELEGRANDGRLSLDPLLLELDGRANIGRLSFEELLLREGEP